MNIDVNEFIKLKQDAITLRKQFKESSEKEEILKELSECMDTVKENEVKCLFNVIEHSVAIRSTAGFDFANFSARSHVFVIVETYLKAAGFEVRTQVRDTSDVICFTVFWT
jgi:hypothetical protein